MKLRKSYIIRIFLVVLTAFLLVMIAGNLWIYSFSRRTVQEEVIRLNQQSLSHMAGSMEKALEEIKDFGAKIAMNSRILEQLDPENNGENVEQEIRDELMEMLAEFGDTHMNGASLVETYIIGNEGLYVSSCGIIPEKWIHLVKEQENNGLWTSGSCLQLPTSCNTGIYGIRGHSFQILLPMYDLLDNEYRGAVVLDVSEVALYNYYKEYENDTTELSIITQEGQIVSAKKKRQIDRDSGYDANELTNVSGWQRDDAGETFLLYEEISGSDWLLLAQIPARTILGTLTQVQNVTLMVTALCMVLAVAILYPLIRKMLRRVLCIRDKMGEVIAGDLTVRIPVVREDEFGEIEAAFNAMVEEINQLIRRVRQTEQQKRVAEMDFLCAQINSHFIHNTLTSIRFMLEMGKVNEAEEMIFYFSRLLRQTLSRSTEFISLRDEVDTLKSYVMLQYYRYQNTFEASYDFPEEIMDIQVPALILQPVVENAIFHGSRQSFTHIRIGGCREGDHLILTVEDDGVGMSEEKQKQIFRKGASLNRVGLGNVHERIRINYGAEYGLQLTSREGEGTRITFVLPVYAEGGKE